LLESAAVSKILSTIRPLPIIDKILGKRPMTLFAIPSLHELLAVELVPHFPFHGTFEEYRFKPLIYLHTSGSTGTPKLVPVKHGLMATVDGWMHLPSCQSKDLYGEKRIFSPFPPFHIAGFNYTIILPCFLNATTVLLPPGVPISAEVVHAVHIHGAVDSTIIPPSIVTELTQHEEYYNALGHLDVLTFAGGPLSEHVAYKVSCKTTLSSTMGSTEYGALPCNPKDPEDWAYFRFDIDATGIEWRESRQEGLYEMVFVRKKEIDYFQGIFVTYPELEEYHTKDCFSRHLTKPYLWKYESRLDDIVVLSNGENLNPVPMEKVLYGCAAIKGVLVHGQGKFQISLLVEPKSHDMPYEEFLDMLRPFIEQANRVCPSYDRLSSDLVVITAPDRPLPRAAKGTIQRAQSYALYKLDLDSLYSCRTESGGKQESSVVTLILDEDPNKHFMPTSAALSTSP
jgi:acyl-coenzyme A synthetase/AMP-(fatty) acid ligase